MHFAAILLNGLRSYGTEPQIWGGDPNHAHEFEMEKVASEIGKGNWSQANSGQQLAAGIRNAVTAEHREPIREIKERGFCHCGAWRGDLGLEPTPELFIQHLVEIFREVRRVLRKDGTLWLNIGDSYAGGGKGGGGSYDAERRQWREGNPAKNGGVSNRDGLCGVPGYKPKDLMMLPAQLALALRADGWYLRSEIVWAKKAPMPESVTDRPTCAHEKVFLLTKSARYFYDAEAVKEEAEYGENRATYAGGNDRIRQANICSGGATNPDKGMARPQVTTRNMRNVWTLGPEPFPEAHFATFVSEIPRRAILAGTSAKGVCGATIKKLRIRRDLTPEQQERVMAFLQKSGPL